MKVLVAGANGLTGRLIIKQLSEETDYQGYAMIRDELQEKTLLGLGAAETVLADLEKDEDLARAVKGMDAVIFAAGSGSGTVPDKTIDVDQEGAKRLIDAAKEEDIDHFVMLSALGVDDPAHSKLEHYLKAKKNADDHLKESGLTYTIVRPGRLNREEGNRQIELKKNIKAPGRRMIPREDVARVLISSLTIPNAKNKTFEILSGEEDIEIAMQEFEQ